ncbi:MAG: biopolymer transporter ExbD [Kiritimatiellia bacterium]
MRDRNKAGRKKKGPPEMPVNSFADIAFLLIIFFVLATKIIQNTGVVAEIPSGEKSEKQSEEGKALQINDEKLIFNDKETTLPALRKKLAGMNLDKKKNVNAKTVTIEASGRVDYQTYFEAMTAISSAGGVIAIVKESKGESK